MAHPQDAEATDAPVSEGTGDPVAELENLLLGEEEEEEEDGAEEGDDLELEEQEDEADEPETAIEAPVSLNAEEKEVFAQLPPEAQQAWAASETRRNTQVQEATTKAAEAQRTADARAAHADAEAKARYSEQLMQVAAAIAPTAPERSWYGDDASYLVACREYDQACAQHNQFVQHVAEVGQEAQTEMDAAKIAQRDQELIRHPSIANPETRAQYINDVMRTAAEAGLDPTHIIRHATGTEFLAIAKIHDRLAAAEAKAAKYDSAMNQKMRTVRAAKGKSLRPNVASTDNQSTAKTAWGKVKSAGSRSDRDAALAEYFQATGVI